jgi:hypothetical protein
MINESKELCKKLRADIRNKDIQEMPIEEINQVIRLKQFTVVKKKKRKFVNKK